MSNFKGRITFFNQDRVKKYSIEFASTSFEGLSTRVHEYVKNEGPHWVILEATEAFGVGVSPDDALAYVYQKNQEGIDTFPEAEYLLKQIEVQNEG